jgi:hypothetical protein
MMSGSWVGQARMWLTLTRMDRVCIYRYEHVDERRKTSGRVIGRLRMMTVLLFACGCECEEYHNQLVSRPSSVGIGPESALVSVI